MEDKTSKMSQLEPNWSPETRVFQLGGTPRMDPGVFNFRKDLDGGSTQQTPAGAPDLIALRALRPRALGQGGQGLGQGGRVPGQARAYWKTGGFTRNRQRIRAAGRLEYSNPGSQGQETLETLQLCHKGTVADMVLI